MNVLLITSDQHNPFVMGCAADPVVQTPHLDALADAGTRFDSAYTNNPICMPARATLATGHYGSTIGAVDNGSAYDGTPESWGHKLRAAGHDAVTFGKLHFLPDADSGFDMRLPLQAKPGYGAALWGWARGDAPGSDVLRQNLDRARPGEFEYTTYDRYTAATAAHWLEHDAPSDRSWAAHVSFAYPHYPFRVPEGYLCDFEPGDIELPPQWEPDAWPDHPAIAHRRRKQMFADPACDEATIRNVRWIYYGMVAFLDELVGQVLGALDATGMADDTLVIYTSDHGDMLGEKGMFMKGVMYEGSAGVPMLVRGPGIAAGHVTRTPVSLADVAPTVLDVILDEVDPALPGRSLRPLATESVDDERVVFSEYHGPGSVGANFMVRRGDLKYVEYLSDGTPPQLFDLAQDPREEVDRSADEGGLVADMAAELRRIIGDPEGLNAGILDEQQRQLAAAGGMDAVRDGWTNWSDGHLLPAYTRPPDEIMEVVGWPDDPDWDDRR